MKFCQFVLKILSGNEILTTIKGHNSATYLQKMTAKNPNLDLVNIHSYIRFGEILSIYSQEIERKGNSGQIKGHNSITNVRKMCNNPKLDLNNINAYTKFGEICSVCSQDIEWKWNYDRRTDRMTDNPNPVKPPFSKWGYYVTFIKHQISIEKFITVLTWIFQLITAFTWKNWWIIEFKRKKIPQTTQICIEKFPRTTANFFFYFLKKKYIFFLLFASFTGTSRQETLLMKLSVAT